LRWYIDQGITSCAAAATSGPREVRIVGDDQLDCPEFATEQNALKVT
jgi:hypothetical protein